MKHDQLVKNTLLLFINKFSGALAAFILLPLYTKYFSAESYGMMDLIVGYVALLALVVSLRLDMGVFRHLVEARGDKFKASEAISTALKLLLILLILMVIASVALGFFVDLPFYYAIILAIISNILFTTSSQIARGLGFMKDFVLISIGVTLISFTTSVLGILVFGVGAEIMLVALIVSQLTGAILMVLRSGTHKMIRWKSSSSVQRELLLYSSPLVADGVSFWVMNTSSRTVLALVLGAAANAMYAVASKFSMIIEQVIGVFFQSFIETAILYAKKPNRSELYSDVMNRYLRLLWSGCIFLVAVMPFIFPLLVHGDDFVAAYLLIPIMIAAVMVRAVQNFIAAIYQANGLTKQIAATTIAGAVINLTMNLVLVFIIGIWSVAVSLLVSYLVLTVYRYHDIRKHGIVLSLHIRNVIVFTGLAISVSVVYYIDVPILSVIGMVLTVLLLTFLNRDTIREAKHYVLDRRKKR